VERRVKASALSAKIVTRSKKYHAHDENNREFHKEGDVGV
jgi:ribosomal protein S17